MKIVLTNKQEIKGKDGRQWVNLAWINPETGTTGYVFCSFDDYVKYGITDVDFLSGKELLETFSSSPIVDADFNERGRVIGLRSV